MLRHSGEQSCCDSQNPCRWQTALHSIVKHVCDWHGDMRWKSRLCPTTWLHQALCDVSTGVAECGHTPSICQAPTWLRNPGRDGGYIDDGAFFLMQHHGLGGVLHAKGVALHIAAKALVPVCTGRQEWAPQCAARGISICREQGIALLHSTTHWRMHALLCVTEDMHRTWRTATCSAVCKQQDHLLCRKRDMGSVHNNWPKSCHVNDKQDATHPP